MNAVMEPVNKQERKPSRPFKLVFLTADGSVDKKVQQPVRQRFNQVIMKELEEIGGDKNIHIIVSLVANSDPQQFMVEASTESKERVTSQPFCRDLGNEVSTVMRDVLSQIDRQPVK
jgi:hypothetical protein